MATCAVMGQAIGTAAAHGSKHEEAPPCAQLAEAPHIENIQRQLLRNDVFLLGMKNDEPENIARHATVVASDEAEGFPASAVLDGVNRFLKSSWGNWADDERHAWYSKQVPAWLELRFPEPMEIREVHLTFESGMERHLTLTASDHYNRRIQRGPQPETVKAYRLLAGEEVIAEETENWQSWRVHRLPAPVRTDCLRLEITATNGVSEARVFEIRAY